MPTRALLLEAGQAQVLVRAEPGFRRQPVDVLATSGAEALVRGLGESDVVAAHAEAVLLTESLQAGEDAR